MNYVIKCPVCQSDNNKRIILLENYPISNLELSLDKETAKKSKTYDMDICMCNICSHIYNKIPVKLEYKQQNATYFTNDSQKKYIIDLVNDVINRYNIKNKKVLEIGSGDGVFLKELYRNNNNCTGYEPSLAKNFEKKNFKIINNYFNPKEDLKENIDFIAIRHVLEHFDNPIDFLNNLIDNLVKIKQNPFIFIEVPNIEPTLNNLRINDFIHEHISYFSPYSLKYLLNLLHLDILELYTTDNNENIVAICKLDINFFAVVNSAERLNKCLKNSIVTFQKDYKKIALENDNIAIWGAEGRGGGFIKMIKDNLKGNEMIIDSDSKKFGKYIPSIGLKISSYKELINKNTDVIIITTAIGTPNILKEINDNNIKVNKIYGLSEEGLKEINAKD